MKDDQLAESYLMFLKLSFLLLFISSIDYIILKWINISKEILNIVLIILKSSGIICFISIIPIILGIIVVYRKNKNIGKKKGQNTNDKDVNR